MTPEQMLLIADPRDIPGPLKDQAIRELQKLVYIGESRFPDLTWKARCEETVADLRVTQRELERWRHGAPIEGDYVCPFEFELTLGPVVPRPYEVTNASDGRWTLWLNEADDQRCLYGQDGSDIVPEDVDDDDGAPAAAVAALAWAIQRDKRPVHEEDK